MPADPDEPGEQPAEPIVVVRPLIPPWPELEAALREVVESQVLTNDGPQVRGVIAARTASGSMVR